MLRRHESINLIYLCDMDLSGKDAHYSLSSILYAALLCLIVTMVIIFKETLIVRAKRASDAGS